MAKVLNYTNYHKINVTDHCHHHCRRLQQQQQKEQQNEKVEQQTKILQIKHQRKQRQTQTTTNQSNNDKNEKHSHFNNNNNYSNNSNSDNNNKQYNSKNNNKEFSNYTTLQQHVANNQATHPHISNTNTEQLTSVSSFKVVKNRKSKSKNSLNNTFLPSLDPPTTSQTLSSPLPPLTTTATTCSYTLSTPSTISSSSATSSAVAVNSSPLTSTSLTSSQFSSSSASYLLNLSTTYSTYSTCCVLTYNMFTAYAEAATLQLKRKTQFNKLLHVSGHTDMRSICYLILMAFFYWGVMIRAAVATNLTTNQAPTSASHVEELNTKTMFYSNLTITRATTIINAIDKEGEGNDPLPPLLLVNSSLQLSVSSHSSDDTLTNYQRRLLMRREAANVPDFEDDDSSYHDELDEYELLIKNKSALGKYIGAPCNNSKCESTLLHVVCEKDTNTCGCEKNYPVQLGLTRGCDKPKKLGEQCFYDETCQYNDENSLCVQVRHNAMCQCASGYHSVSYTKPTRRVFCTQDIDELNSDLPTLLGVCVGIGVLAGLICMVLHLFSKTKYPRHRNFGDANLPPPIMYSSETVQSGRPSSRSSIRSSGGSIGSYGNRRSSTGGVGVGGNNSATAGSKGILVSTSRTGSRRPSLASVHSTSSSVRSYSMMRFEKEQQQKEIRQEMKLRLARLQQHQHQQQHQQHLSQYKPQIIIGDTAVSMQHGVALSRITMATPSPITPNSTDELLPAVDESQEYQPKSEMINKPPYAESVASATISAIKNVAASSGTNQNMTSTTNAAIASSSTSNTGMDLANAAAYIGPCSSSNEAL